MKSLAEVLRQKKNFAPHFDLGPSDYNDGPDLLFKKN